jgi:hypothetical protein
MPVLWIDLQVLQDRGAFLSIAAPSVLSKDATDPVNQFEIVLDFEGRPLDISFRGFPMNESRYAGWPVSY